MGNPVEDAIKFAVIHSRAFIIGVVALFALAFFFSITETGKDTWALLKKHPEIFFLLAGVIMVAAFAYMMLMRPKDMQKMRIPPRELWKLVVDKNPDIHSDVSKLTWEMDPLEGVFFTGPIFAVSRTTIKVHDVPDGKEGTLFEKHERNLTSEEIRGRKKTAMRWEDKAQGWARADAERDALKQEIKRGQDYQETFGNGGSRP